MADDPRVAALLAERAAIALRPDAGRRQAEIDEVLAGLGYEQETAVPDGELETAVPPPKRRGRPPAGG